MFDIGSRVTIWSPVAKLFIDATVVRMWDHPEGDPYVSVETAPGKIWVRSQSCVYLTPAGELNRLLDGRCGPHGLESVPLTPKR